MISGLIYVILCLFRSESIVNIFKHKESFIYSQKFSQFRSLQLLQSIQSNDICNIPYVGDWNYYYRKNGMKTSSEDVMLAYYAVNHNFNHSSEKPLKYIDLGCGIGSTFLLVCNYLSKQPFRSDCLGIEAQTISYDLLIKTLNDINKSNYKNKSISMNALNADLRYIMSNATIREDISNIDIITANPPYLSLSSGSLPKDSQRLYARFECRGSIDDYFIAVKNLIKIETGRFLVSYLFDTIDKVLDAAKLNGLILTRQINVITNNDNKPHLVILEFYLPSKFNDNLVPLEIINLDISRDQNTKSMGKIYKDIQNSLHMKPKPINLRKGN